MKGPLLGLSVVDCTQWVQGSMIGVMLGDMGADIIKIEEPVNGDQMRGWLQTGFSAQTHRVERNYMFEVCNRSKRSMTLNLKQEKGKEIFYALIKRADIFVHNWRGEDVPKRLGVDYETLSKINPQLIYSQASGWGPEGPISEEPAYEGGAQARSGMLDLFAEPDGPLPIFPGGVGDIIAATTAVVGILAALEARRRLDKGQKVDTSLLGSQLQVLALQIGSLGIAKEIYPRRSRARHGNPLWNNYRCADGKWLNFSMTQPDRYWHNFCQAVGLSELENDPRFENLTVRAQNAVELTRILDRHFTTRPRDEWIRQLAESNVELIYAPVQTIPEVFADPQVLANEYVVDFNHPVFGLVKIPGIPHKFSETPAEPQRAAPEFGQHTEEVLLELGYTWADITKLKDEKAI